MWLPGLQQIGLSPPVRRLIGLWAQDAMVVLLGRIVKIELLLDTAKLLIDLLEPVLGEKRFWMVVNRTSVSEGMRDFMDYGREDRRRSPDQTPGA
jgi:hypothetical protein